jgi:hypothetical protein
MLFAFVGYHGIGALLQFGVEGGATVGRHAAAGSLVRIEDAPADAMDLIEGANLIFRDAQIDVS